MSSSVLLKEESKEDKKARLKNQCKLNQRKYNDWKRIVKEFNNICLEKSEEELLKEEEENRSRKEINDKRRLAKKVLKHERKVEEKIEKKADVKKARYKRNAENVKRWRIENKDYYRELCKESYKRRVERHKAEVN
jgi:hypothetical protein